MFASMLSFTPPPHPPAASHAPSPPAPTAPPPAPPTPATPVAPSPPAPTPPPAVCSCRAQIFLGLRKAREARKTEVEALAAHSSQNTCQ